MHRTNLTNIWIRLQNCHIGYAVHTPLLQCGRSVDCSAPCYAAVGCALGSIGLVAGGMLCAGCCHAVLAQPAGAIVDVCRIRTLKVGT